MKSAILWLRKSSSLSNLDDDVAHVVLGVGVAGKDK
jgi:hypothetical protein